MVSQPYVIDVIWDEEADVYVASSEHVPGLVTEAGSLDALFERVKAIMPELLVENGVIDETDAHDLPVIFEAHRTDLTRRSA